MPPHYPFTGNFHSTLIPIPYYIHAHAAGHPTRPFVIDARVTFYLSIHTYIIRVGQDPVFCAPQYSDNQYHYILGDRVARVPPPVLRAVHPHRTPLA